MSVGSIALILVCIRRRPVCHCLAYVGSRQPDVKAKREALTVGLYPAGRQTETLSGVTRCVVMSERSLETLSRTPYILNSTALGLSVSQIGSRSLAVASSSVYGTCCRFVRLRFLIMRASRVRSKHVVYDCGCAYAVHVVTMCWFRSLNYSVLRRRFSTGLVTNVKPIRYSVNAQNYIRTVSYTHLTLPTKRIV